MKYIFSKFYLLSCLRYNISQPDPDFSSNILRANDSSIRSKSLDASIIPRRKPSFRQHVSRSLVDFVFLRPQPDYRGRSVNCFKFMKTVAADEPRQQRHHQHSHLRPEHRGCGQVPLLSRRRTGYPGFRDGGRMEARHTP